MQPGVSFVLSTKSLLIAYAQLALYAVGTVLEQLLRAINLSSKDKIREVLPVEIKSYGAPTTAIFEMYIKFYGNVNYPLSPTFIQEAIEIFNSDGQNLDFSENEKAAEIINDWVNNKTHGLIDHLVESSMFSKNTRLVLLNVIYFWNNWKHQFNPNDTQNKDFYLTPEKTKSIPTMYQQGSFNYYESDDLDAQILEIPYKDDNFTYMLWLPRKIDGLSIMVEKLRNPDTVIKSLSSFIKRIVKIYHPVMHIETSSDMKDLSIKGNITEMFIPQSDGFKGITSKNDPLYVSDVKQRCVIKVTETGTEAAVATAVIITRQTAVFPQPEIIIVDANRPFVFSVFFKGNPVFSGIFAGV